MRGRIFRAPSSRYADRAGRPTAAIKNISTKKAAAECKGRSAHVQRARQQFAGLYRDAIAIDHHRALGHRQVAGEDVDRVVFRGFQLDDGAAAEPEHLVIGIEVVPSTTLISTETLSKVLTVPLPVVPYMNEGWLQVTMVW
jgi:hypothetical protein